MRKFFTLERLFHIGTLMVLLFLVLFSFRHYLFHTYTNDAFVRFNIYPVNSQVAAVIDKVLIKDNEIVKKGQSLILLNEADYKQHILAAEANIAYYKFLLKSEKKLYSERAVSHKNYLESLKDYENSLALLQHYKIELAKHQVKAAHGGVVTNMYLQKGTYVNIGEPLFTIIDKKSAYVQANFLERSIRHISIGDKAEVILSTSGEVYYGTVRAISSGISIEGLKTNTGLQAPIEDYNWFPIPRRVPVYIKLDNIDPNDKELINGTHAGVYIL